MTIEIRLNNFPAPLTAKSVTQRLLSDYFTRPQRKWINEKTMFFTELTDYPADKWTGNETMENYRKVAFVSKNTRALKDLI